ncbi:uncharacterized protein LOC124158463 isoform X2 [Ischnura elegans]|uniref:uncharacterized protein LOC124158463 isoform X2 n=1 Tax=Ischnura elegans TaxID=197161 RepID=UPI001ED87008|nr:uncharacterized protein LOC124158463 isoform X2 [Ischnura elegans]
MDCDRRNVSLLDEEKCMVVEFVNEDSEGEEILLAVGYQNWLTDEDKKNLPSIVERKTTVNVLWPNCDVKPVREMKKNVKGMTIWQNTAVKILGIGGWVDMCRLRKSFEKHDCVVVTKEDRRRVARKRGSSSTDEEERNPREECSTSQKIAKKKKKTIPQQRESRKHRRGSKNASTCKEQDLWKQLRRNGNTAADCLGDDSSDSDVEENYKDVSKSELILKVEIQAEEIRQLRSEVARLKSLKILNEDLGKMLEVSKNVLKNMNRMQRKTGIQLGSERYPSETSELNKENHPGKPFRPSASAPLLPAVIVNEMNNAVEGQPRAGVTALLLPEGSVNEVNKAAKGQPREVTTAPLLPEGNVTEVGEICVFGGTEYSRERIAKCNHSSARQLATDLAVMVFSMEELGTCTLTGTKANVFLKNTVEVKPALDKGRVEDIIGYVKKFFPTKEDEGQMRNGIKKKCNNISNMLKNKCIRKET